jgi:hypothetical protein
MSNAGAATAVGTRNYRFAGILALVGAALLLTHAGYAGSTDDRIHGLLQVGCVCMSAAVVLLAVTITAARGRNIAIALGMFGAMTGAAGAVTELVTGEPGFLSSIALICPFAGALIVGLSFPKPRTGYPQASVYAALSGAVLLILIGGLGIITDDRFNAFAYVVPAIAWAWLARVLLSPEPLPPRPKPTTQTPRTRPAGSTKKKRKPRKKR